MEAGAIRAKNTKKLLLKTLLDQCVAAVCWWTVGAPNAIGAGAVMSGCS